VLQKQAELFHQATELFHVDAHGPGDHDGRASIVRQGSGSTMGMGHPADDDDGFDDFPDPEALEETEELRRAAAAEAGEEAHEQALLTSLADQVRALSTIPVLRL
jgi:hypothetical protein